MSFLGPAWRCAERPRRGAARPRSSLVVRSAAVLAAFNRIDFVVNQFDICYGQALGSQGDALPRPDQVDDADWLETLGLEQYEAAFDENASAGDRQTLKEGNVPCKTSLVRALLRPPCLPRGG